MNNTEDDIWDIMNDLKEEEYVKENGERDTGIICSCGCNEFIVEDAMQICTKCSAICSKVIDNTAEWRYYGNDSKSDDPSRCGLPTNSLLPKSSLGSMIGGNKYGNNYDIRRIRKFIAWNSMPYNERTLWLVFDILTSNSLSN
jgi:transcription initiation factor TFIIIB Brf1 subunit/transcription initiation factor TFIIB